MSLAFLFPLHTWRTIVEVALVAWLTLFVITILFFIGLALGLWREIGASLRRGRRRR